MQAIGSKGVRSGMTRAGLALLAGCAGLAVSATTASGQRDRIIDAPTGWQYFYGATSATIDTQITNGWRPFFLNRVGSNAYDVIFVPNSGAYAAAGSDAYYGSTPANFNLSMSLGNRAPLTLEAQGASPLIYAASVSETVLPGAVWTTTQPTTAALVNWATNNNVRVIDIDKNTSTGDYSAVGVPNTGANAQAWWWYFGVNETQIVSFLTTNNARLTDVVLESPGTLFTPPTFSVIMVGQNPGIGIIDMSMDAAAVTNLINHNKVRLTVLERYTNPQGQTRWAVAAVDNASTEERRIRNLMNDNYDGIKTFAMKEVGGNFRLTMNENYATEPASSMKIVHAAYAVDRAAAGLANLTTTQVFNESTCGPLQQSWNNACPDNVGGCNPSNLTLGETIRRTMQNSDNMCTNALEVWAGNGNQNAGRTTLNNFMGLLGFSSHNINHTLGCLCGQTPNVMTAREFCDFYELIDDGSLFNTDWQEELYSRMNRWNGFQGVISTIITQEAAGTSLTTAELNTFRTRVDAAAKAGGYVCNGQGWRGFAGRVSLPQRVNIQGNAVYTTDEFTGAMFVQDAAESTGPDLVYTHYWELFREVIREELQAWDAGCTTPTVTNQPDTITRSEGDDAVFTVTAGGSNLERTYAWQKSNSSGGPWSFLADGAAYSGTQTAQLTVLNVDENDDDFYRVVITSACGTVNSAAAELNVTPCVAPSFLTQPASQEATAGDNVVFSVAVAGSSFNRTFRWQRRASILQQWSDMADAAGQVQGSGTSTLTLLDVDSGDQAQYRLRVTNVCGTVNTNAATLNISQCDSVDFNNDGVFPDDQDLADYLRVYGGGNCATCNDVDFNNDGVFPDDGDLEALLRVLGGGTC